MVVRFLSLALLLEACSRLTKGQGVAYATSSGKEETDLLKEYGEILKEGGVKTLELLTCRVGKDKNGFVEDIADHTGLRIEAHKHKIGFWENDEGEAISYHTRPGTKLPMPGDASTHMTPAVERVEEPSDANSGAGSENE